MKINEGCFKLLILFSFVLSGHAFCQTAPSSGQSTDFFEFQFSRFGSPFNAQTTLALEETVEAQIGPVSLRRGQGDYWIVTLERGNPHPSLRHLKAYVKQFVLAPLAQASANYLGKSLEDLLPIPPIIWPRELQGLMAKLQTLISPFAVEAHEYSNDLKVRSRLRESNLELPDPKYIVDGENIDHRDSPIKTVAVHSNEGNQREERAYTPEELIDVYSVLRPLYDQGELDGCSEHLQQVYGLTDTALRKDFRTVFESGKDLSLDSLQTSDVDSILRLARYETEAWFPQDEALFRLLDEGDQVDPRRYQQEERYRQMVRDAVPHVADAIDQRIEGSKEINSRLWMQMIYFAEANRFIEDPRLAMLTKAFFGSSLKLTELSDDKLRSLRPIIHALVDGFDLSITGWIEHLGAPADKIEIPLTPRIDAPDFIVKVTFDSAEAPQRFRLIDLFINYDEVVAGHSFGEQIEVTGGGEVGFFYGRTGRYGCEIIEGAHCLFTASQHHHFQTEVDLDEHAEHVANLYATTISANLLPVGLLSGLSAKAFGGLVLRGMVYSAIGTGLVAAGRSVYEGELVLPELDRLGHSSFQFGVMFGLGGGGAALVKKALPRITPLLATTLGMTSSAALVTSLQGASLPEVGVTTLKLATYSLFGGFADLLHKGSAGLLSGGFRVYLANTAISGVGGAIEYETIGFTDALGYKAEHPIEAAVIAAVESTPLDIGGARASTRVDLPIKTLFVVGPGNPSSLGISRALESLQKKDGLKIVLLAKEEPAHISGIQYELIQVDDPTDAAEIIAATDTYLSTQSSNVDANSSAVVSPIEGTVRAAALLADHLRVQGLTAEQADAARNKYQMRTIWRDRGLPTPWFKRVPGWEDATAEILAKYEEGKAVIVKPVEGASSLGLLEIDPKRHTREDVERELGRAQREWDSNVKQQERAYQGNELIIEEKISGAEFCVDVLVFRDQQGNVQVVPLKPLLKQPVIAPTFTEYGFFTLQPVLGEGIDAEIRRRTVPYIEALGFDRGVFHFEGMVDRNIQTGTLEMVAIENGARPAGGVIGGMLELATDGALNIYDLQNRALLGQPLDRQTVETHLQQARPIAARVVSTQVEGVIASVDASKLPQGVHYHERLRAGDPINTVNDHLGYLYVSGDYGASVPDLYGILNDAMEKLEINFQNKPAPIPLDLGPTPLLNQAEWRNAFDYLRP